jgi:hypothetical protein
MWEPRRLTTLQAFTACYRDSFTFYVPLNSRHPGYLMTMFELQTSQPQRHPKTDAEYTKIWKNTCSDLFTCPSHNIRLRRQKPSWKTLVTTVGNIAQNRIWYIRKNSLFPHPSRAGNIPQIRESPSMCAYIRVHKLVLGEINIPRASMCGGGKRGFCPTHCIQVVPSVNSRVVIAPAAAKLATH